MDDSHERNASQIHEAVTIEFPTDPGEWDNESSADDSLGKMKLTNRAECTNDQTLPILFNRLVLASLTLATGCVVFLCWYVVLFLQGHGDPLVLSMLTLVFVALSGCWGLMKVFRPKLCWQLHLLEMAVFGFPAILFLVWQHSYAMHYTATYSVLPNMSGAWVLLIFVYALFIPNSVQRAATVITIVGALPILMTLYLVRFHPECCQAMNANSIHVWAVVLQMLITCVAATVGVYSIGSLRHEVTVAKQLGQYVLQEKIGEGGMGEVYYAEHKLLHRPCAIKLIRPEKAGDPGVLKRFEREVRATAKLSHWNNVDIYDYGRNADGTFYYVMEYLPGMNLHQLVTRFGSMEPGRIIYLTRQICYALNEAHRMGLIHRDIKPGNIIATPRGGLYDVAKLVDFGLARPLSSNEGAHLTHDNMVTGSPLFMSPEQATGQHDPDARSDIYSLGCVAYFLATGRPPFDFTQPIKAIVAHASHSVVPPSTINPDIPADLEEVILRCMEKEPEDRFQTSCQLMSALDGCESVGDWTMQMAAEWWENHIDDSPAKRPSELREVAVATL